MSKGAIKVLVTGATGFVGRQLVEQLKNEQKIEIVRIVRREEEAWAKQDIIVPNINGNTDWTNCFDTIDVVIHLAAKVHDMRYADNEDVENEYYQVNYLGTKCLSEAAGRAGVEKVIFLSTVKVNGSGDENAVATELDEVKPKGSYAKSKFLAEKCIIDGAQQYGFSYTIIRPTLVFGTNVKGNLFRLMQVVAAGIPIPIGKRDNKRSMIGLQNLCDFIIFSATNKVCNNSTFLLSESRPLSTRELCEKIADHMDKELRLLIVPDIILGTLRKLERFNRVYSRVCGDFVVSNEKLLTTKWTYKYSIEEQIKNMVDDFVLHKYAGRFPNE